jgi:L-iditol 2-dehydrogenase
LILLANILVEPGRIELREIEIPQPSGGEILVRIRASLTCGTDLKAFRRGHPVIPMPGVFGHEFSGIVAARGKGVKRFREGDGIMAVHSAPCLECRYCRKNLYNLCEKIMHTKILGAFAEYILLPSHIVKQNVFRKPEGLPFEEAAFLEPLSCVVHGLESISLKKDDHALVIGAGPIGLLHLLLLKNMGVKVSIADRHDKKLKIAKELGAHSVAKADRMVALKKRANNGIGFDYVFECTGMPEVWESSVNYVRRGGTVVLFGGCKTETTVTYDAGKLHYGEITLQGVFHYTPPDVKKAYALLCRGRLGISRLISGRYPLRQTQKAFDRLLKGVGIKYAIIP